MIYIKIHGTENGKMVAMCDEELMGKVLSEGGKEIDLKRYADFYRGELVSDKKAAEIIKGIEIYSANAVGKKSLNVLRGKMDLSSGEVKHINKVPFVQIYTVI